VEDRGREKARARAQKFVSLLHRGVITEPEMVRGIIDGLEPDHIDEFVSFYPDFVRDAVRRFVESAPKSDSEWGKFRIFYIGPESAKALALAKIEFRRNTEALREFFGLVS